MKQFWKNVIYKCCCISGMLMMAALVSGLFLGIFIIPILAGTHNPWFLLLFLPWIFLAAVVGAIGNEADSRGWW